jgi:methylthioribose-1-phosphate isomerase
MNKDDIIKAAEYLKTARPTAVNLMYVCDAIVSALNKHTDQNPEAYIKLTCETANSLLEREIEMNDKMAKVTFY